MVTVLILVIILILLFGAYPRANAYNANWGWGPFGMVGFILFVLFVLWLTGHLHISLPS